MSKTQTTVVQAEIPSNLMTQAQQLVDAVGLVALMNFVLSRCVGF